MLGRACLVGLVLMGSVAGCAQPESAPPVEVHYLGHAAFVLQFGGEVSVLIDYGRSRSYGLDSPIEDVTGADPDVVIYSHGDGDHDRGAVFESAQVLTGGEPLTIEGLEITAIPTSERGDSPDNFSYLFVYEGLRILHLADAQYLIANLEEEGIEERVLGLYPDTYDLLLMTIDGRSPIMAEAAAFADLLRPRRLVPMHYWGVGHREVFLDELRAREGFTITEPGGSQLALDGADPAETVQVVCLEPGALELAG